MPLTFEPAARVLADSMPTPGGVRLTTMELTMHRYVLAEFNTHRVLSRNSASSRAIPLTKTIDRVTAHPALPVVWPAEKRGMQGGDALPDNDRANAEALWLIARNQAVEVASNLGILGVHKSVVNRLLEPFMWHTAIVTSTAWQNFFALRTNVDAQPEIKACVDLAKAAYDESTPTTLHPGGWHTPLVTADDHARLIDEFGNVGTGLRLRQVSAARCARVSHLTHDGRRDVLADLELFERLVAADPMHASPLEHVARPEPTNDHVVTVQPTRADVNPLALHLPRYGNLRGWHSLRFDTEAERAYRSFS